MDHFMNRFLNMSNNVFEYSRDSSSDLIKHLKDEVDRLNRDLYESHQDTLAARQERDQLNIERGSLRKELSTAQQEKLRIQQGLAQARKRISEAEHRTSQLNHELTELTAENSNLKLENKRYCASAKKLAEQIKKQEREIGEWKNTSTMYERRFYNLRNSLVQIQDVVDDGEVGGTENEGEMSSVQMEFENISEPEDNGGENSDNDVIYIATRQANEV